MKKKLDWFDSAFFVLMVLNVAALGVIAYWGVCALARPENGPRREVPVVETAPREHRITIEVRITNQVTNIDWKSMFGGGTWTNTNIPRYFIEP